MKYKALRELGYIMLGPVIGPFAISCAKKVIEDGVSTAFISREGFHLRRLVRHCLSGFGHQATAPLHHVAASRAFLFKLTLGKEQLLPLALSHPFEGSVADLLEGRFALSPSDMATIGPTPRVRVSLPRDAELVAGIINNITAPIHAEIEGKREIYREYIMTFLGSRKNLLCVDVGFAGTIQRLLSDIYNIKTQGYYMFFSGSDAIKADGFWSSDAKHGAGDALVDLSLVLEAVLTAPTGQLRDVRRDDSGKIDFLYGPLTRVQDEFHITYALVDGVKDFIDAAACLGDQNIDQIIDVRKNFLIQLRHNRSREAESLRCLLEVDDCISGNGLIRPFQFLPGLR
ncbi:hypothetical protein M5E06_33035 [Azospirillum sp. A1-3]|uniref:hypothetical protein n=1 Tax=Azospirillum sp. A1-3 TaxID=185874 RepID=UPI002076DB0E|nr:hypothetical protein [Azospirillum sp. A1-3]MCM8738911.1 hypothetical protein [Azospirillum sp. A1-3]